MVQKENLYGDVNHIQHFCCERVAFFGITFQCRQEMQPENDDF